MFRRFPHHLPAHRLPSHEALPVDEIGWTWRFHVRTSLQRLQKSGQPFPANAAVGLHRMEFERIHQRSMPRALCTANETTGCLPVPLRIHRCQLCAGAHVDCQLKVRYVAAKGDIGIGRRLLLSKGRYGRDGDPVRQRQSGCSGKRQILEDLCLGDATDGGGTIAAAPWCISHQLSVALLIWLDELVRFGWIRPTIECRHGALDCSTGIGKNTRKHDGSEMDRQGAR
mmetsp:Transcript_25035/g.72422  ORF Transcript_25035/g.72422 Transcript_25035/m.72422 type:complete len:227 (-) Transcript_25035:169-849(-)